MIRSIFFLVAVTFSPSAHAAFEIYMSPDGHPNNSGLNINEPVRTLQNAQNILLTHDPQESVEILIAPGEYKNQSVDWTYDNGYTIEFVSLVRDNQNRPVFKRDLATGNTRATSWFEMSIAEGSNTNIIFNNIEVQNYTSAIAFIGNRDDIARGWNGNNHIKNMVFRNIGDKYSPGTGYRAITFQNSNGGSVTNSKFINIENGPETVRLIHAIYLAHGARNIIIADNEFERVSGEPVRVRNESNYNIITRNKIDNSGQSGFYSDYYSRNANECPSWGNEFILNTVGDRYLNDNDQNPNDLFLPMFYFHELPDDYCGQTPEQRLRTQGNIRN